MKFVVFVLLLVLSVVYGQFGDAFGGSSYGGRFAQSASTYRDARADRGPVLFPPSPEDTETSNVIVGASGYGFVPPAPRGFYQQYNPFYYK